MHLSLNHKSITLHSVVVIIIIGKALFILYAWVRNYDDDDDDNNNNNNNNNSNHINYYYCYYYNNM